MIMPLETMFTLIFYKSCRQLVKFWVRFQACNITL